MLSIKLILLNSDRMFWYLIISSVCVPVIGAVDLEEVR